MVIRYASANIVDTISFSKFCEEDRACKKNVTIIPFNKIHNNYEKRHITDFKGDRKRS